MSAESVHRGDEVRGWGTPAATRVKAVLFDAAGTLFNVRGSVGTIYARIALRHGVTADPVEIQREFARAFRARAADGLMTRGGLGPVSAEKEWWKDVVRMVFAGRMAGTVMDRYFEDVFEAFRRAESWELFPDTVPCLQGLRSMGCRLGVLSNFDSRLFELLDDLRLSTFFETVIISWRAGSAKPEKEIFMRAAEAMEAAPNRILHVGDCLTDDYEGARNAGLMAVLLDRSGEYADRDDVTRIGSLLEIPAFLGCGSRPPDAGCR